MEEMRQENARLKKALAEEELKKKKMKGTLDKYKEDQVIDRLSAIDAVKKTTSNSCNNDRVPNFVNGAKINNIRAFPKQVLSKKQQKRSIPT